MEDMTVGNWIKDYWKAACWQTSTSGLEEGSWKSTLNNRE